MKAVDTKTEIVLKRPTSSRQIFADLASVPGKNKKLSKPSPRPAMLTSLERSKTSLYMATREKSFSLKERESTLSRQQLNRKITQFRQKILQSASLAQTLQSVGQGN